MARFIFSIAILWILSHSVGCAQDNLVDLSSWQTVAYNLPSGGVDAVWVLSANNTTVTQTRNADPSIFISDSTLTNFTMEGSFRVPSSGDDDFIGFVFGHQDSSHMYIFDWKRGVQNQSGYGYALEGFTIRKIASPLVSDLRLPDFWSSTDTTHMTVLSSSYGSDRGWTTNATYTFKLQFEAGLFSVWIHHADSMLWTATVSDSSYLNGRFGFYNHSQDNVQYAGFIQTFAPTLQLSQTVNFDGTAIVTPQVGDSLTAFEFRINYLDRADSLPVDGSPLMYVDYDRDGLPDDSITLVQSDTDSVMVDGADYSGYMQLPAGSQCQVRFTANSTTGLSATLPESGWLDGPRVYGCCVGTSGNVDADAFDETDISDLTKLVRHLFITFEPLSCIGESNINGDEACTVDLSDVTKLVNHLFVTFEEPAPCGLVCE